MTPNVVDSSLQSICAILPSRSCTTIKHDDQMRHVHRLPESRTDLASVKCVIAVDVYRQDLQLILHSHHAGRGYCIVRAHSIHVGKSRKAHAGSIATF